MRQNSTSQNTSEIVDFLRKNKKKTTPKKTHSGIQLLKINQNHVWKGKKNVSPVYWYVISLFTECGSATTKYKCAREAAVDMKLVAHSRNIKWKHASTFEQMFC